jgi:hypothetical protein
MKRRISGLVAVTAVAIAGLVGSAQTQRRTRDRAPSLRSGAGKFSAGLVGALLLIGCGVGSAPAEAQTIETLGGGFIEPFGVAVDGAAMCSSPTSATTR